MSSHYKIRFFDNEIRVSHATEKGETPAFIIHPPRLKSAHMTAPLTYLITDPTHGSLEGRIVYDPLRTTLEAFRENNPLPAAYVTLGETPTMRIGYSSCELRHRDIETLPHAKQFEQAGLGECIEVYAHNMGPSTLEFYRTPQGAATQQNTPSHVAVAYTEAEDILHLLPLALKNRATADAASRKMLKTQYTVPVPEIIIKTENPNKDSKFAQKVLAEFQPLCIREAFPYIPQSDEQERFHAYITHGTDSIVLDGPTGNGKSTLVRDHLCSTRQPHFYIAGRENMTYDRLVAVDRQRHDGSGRTSPGALLLSFIWDVPLYLEEGARIPPETWGDIREVLEQNRIFIDSEYGPEYIHPGKNWRMIVTGNFSPRYTANNLDDAIWQRMSIIDIPAPDEAHMHRVLEARAAEYSGVVTDEHVDLLATVNHEVMRQAEKYSDLGLKGAARIVKLIGRSKGDILNQVSLESMIIDNIVSPVAKQNRRARDELVHLVRKYLS